LVPTDWNEIKQGDCVFSVISTAERARAGLEPTGSAANWRCIILEKLTQVKLVEGSWHTAPNHSRPASCVVDPDIDAEDYRADERPQKGQ